MSTKKEPLTNEQYVNALGQVCPYCGSDHVEAVGQFEVSCLNAYQNVICQTCETEWTDEYTLIGYTPS
jgi:transposase-like protein